MPLSYLLNLISTWMSEIRTGEKTSAYKASILNFASIFTVAVTLPRLRWKNKVENDLLDLSVK